MRIRDFLNCRGFSLTETLVAAGLLGGVSLVTMRLMENSAQNESYVRFRSEVSKAVAIITTHLNDPNSCKSILVGKTFLGTPVATPVSAGNYYNGDGVIRMTNRLGTATITLLQHNASYDGFRIPLGGISLQRNLADSATQKLVDLILVFDVKKLDVTSRKVGSNQRITKKITMKVEASGTTITSCGPIIAEANATAKQVLCTSLSSGAAYWDGTECRLKAIRCPYGQVPFQMTSLGSVSCVPVEQKIDPSQVFDYTIDTCLPGQSVRLTTGAGGKIKAECF